ncbi:hypothetical protein [Bacillus sp. CGMCC 1.16541]|uniref:hypothetical protein n=1 Tax=Bacillus sp. CGMCC 1.16541 TaxID=2185143 RepID=UPI000D73867B|nr:hypothetical protein [Bacillus sp. CGMCC 1.16541]
MSDINVAREHLCGTKEVADIEIAIETIIEKVNAINQLLVFDKSYELIYFEDDVKEKMKGLSIKEKNTLMRWVG